MMNFKVKWNFIFGVKVFWFLGCLLLEVGVFLLQNWVYCVVSTYFICYIYFCYFFDVQYSNWYKGSVKCNCFVL